MTKNGPKVFMSKVNLKDDNISQPLINADENGRKVIS
jgi:hypothetical protein